MKKWVKVTLAIAGSLLTIVVLALVVVCTVIFTPEYITPIVKGQLDKNLPFKVDFSRADLVFFRSFPNFSVRISDIRVGDSDSGDCAAGLSEVFVDIDLMAFLRRNEIVLEELSISDGKVDVDALLALMSEGEDEVNDVDEEVAEELKDEVDEEKEELETGSGIGELKDMVPFDIVDIRKVKASNLTILYGVDSSMRAELEGVSLDLKLKMEREAVCGLIDFKSESSRVVFDAYCGMNLSLLPSCFPSGLLLTVWNWDWIGHLFPRVSVLLMLMALSRWIMLYGLIPISLYLFQIAKPQMCGKFCLLRFYPFLMSIRLRVFLM